MVEDGPPTGVQPVEAYRSYLKVLARTRLPAGLCRHLDDSDLVQMTLVEAHRDQAAFRGRSRGEQMAWLRKILARNMADAIKGLRRAKRDIARNVSLKAQLDRSAARMEHWWADEHASTPSMRAHRAERIVALADGIERLPDDQREAIVLRHLQGLDLKTIAELMDRSTSSVASLLHRGLTTLRAEAPDEDGA